MYKFKAKSNIVLGLLSLLALLALIAVENGKMDVKQEWYNEKLEAAQLSQAAAARLRDYRLENGVFIDEINDPNHTAMIGQEYSLITTDQGDLPSKLSSTNPNFAAIVVQLLKDAGLNAGDNVAVAFSGSFPDLNISVIAAIETLKMTPIIITSVGASNFGANDPYFTWLDMEDVLNKSGIFHYRSVAASIGGGNDLGRGLSPEGRDLIVKAIERNEVEFINEKHLEASITKRMELYEKNGQGHPMGAFVNVGGGIASLGTTINGQLIPSGLTEHLPTNNFPVQGVIIQMCKKGLPIIHILNINQLLEKYDLPINPVPLPEPGEGGIFIQKKYNVITTAVATFILLTVIVFIFISERKRHRLGTDPVPLADHGTTGKTDNSDDEDIPL
jgi:poly-gamma-glutamate system protein